MVNKQNPTPTTHYDWRVVEWMVGELKKKKTALPNTTLLTTRINTTPKNHIHNTNNAS